MKILLVTFSDNADHQDTTFGMYEALREDKEVEAFLLAIKTPRVSLKKSNHTWLVDCPQRPGICKKTFDIPLLFTIIRKIKKQHFDAIYFESLHVWNLPIMVAIKGRSHIYHVIHDVIPHEKDSSWRQVDWFNKVLVRLADTIVLRNKKFISTLISRYNVPQEKVRYLELWRRYIDYTPSVHSHRVLFFGRMNPYKGINNLLEIVKQCPNLAFDIVGKIDPQVRDIVQKLKEEPNVSLISGYVSDEDMKHSFINADWIIVPYNSATQSGIIIDAYKYSRPVIAFNVGAISEQVIPGKSGFLVDSGDVKAFSQCLQEVSQMRNTFHEKFCQQAYAVGCQKYAAAGKVEEFKKFIKENL
jgi:glycosyltransferase involved in cell wall biosynthesis